MPFVLLHMYIHMGAVHAQELCANIMYACMCVCVYVCMYVCMYACMYVCMYACMHACMHVCMYVLRANINRDRSSTALQGLGFRVGGLGMSYERTSTGIGVARPCSWAPTPPPDQPIFRSIAKPLFEELSGVCWV